MKALPVVLLVMTGCALGPSRRVIEPIRARDVDDALLAYEQFRTDEGPSPGLLRKVAALLLEIAATGGDEAKSRAALSELGRAGVAGERPLRNVIAHGPELARAGALHILASAGGARSREELRDLLRSEDPRVVAQAVIVVNPRAETDRLLEWLAGADPSLRNAVAQALRGAAPDGQVRAELAETARVDPDPQVRASAVRSLGAFGSDAFEFARERLGDSNLSVRMAAIAAMVQIDAGMATNALGPLLGTPPSPDGIEAARVLLARASTPDDGNAAIYLEGALSASEPALRSQAAIALLSVHASNRMARLIERLAREDPDRSVRLGLGLALLEDRPRPAKRVLGELLNGNDMVAVQAAAALAPAGEENALAKLREGLASSDVALRRVAGPSLARDARRPDEARTALRDEDAMVRIRTAGGILASE